MTTTTGRQALDETCGAFLSRGFNATTPEEIIAMHGQIDAFLSIAEGYGITNKERLAKTGGWIATPVVKESRNVPGAFVMTESDKPSRTQQAGNYSTMFEGVVRHVRKEAQYMQDGVVIDVASLQHLLALHP